MQEMDVLEITGSAYGLGCPFPQNGQNERPVAIFHGVGRCGSSRQLLQLSAWLLVVKTSGANHVNLRSGHSRRISSRWSVCFWYNSFIPTRRRPMVDWVG